MRYFEDLAVGQTFESGTVTVETEAIKAFAAEFDPQPFHLDEEAARASLFGGLVASGWHTAAITMRLLVGGDLKVVGGLIGMGVEELRWPPSGPSRQRCAESRVGRSWSCARRSRSPAGGSPRYAIRPGTRTASR